MISNWKRVKPIEGENMLPVLEKELAIRFPASYVECATQNNGASSIKEGIFSEELNNVLEVRGLLRIDQGSSNIYEVYQDLKDRMPPKTVPFARDSFGNKYCFVFEGDSEPRVVFWNHEESDADTSALASSFDDFLDKLLTVEEALELGDRLEEEEERERRNRR